jgi:hypothetical protein
MIDPAPKRRWLSSRFVHDGYDRAQSAAEPEIRAQVIAEYAAQIEAAGIWDRFWLWETIEREITTRLNQQAPPDALY